MTVVSPTTQLKSLTPALRATLLQRKTDVLAVLWRLEGMHEHVDPVPTAKGATEAPGGPGRCFSCGKPLGHPEAYGRCVPCGIAAELFYTSLAADEAGTERIA